MTAASLARPTSTPRDRSRPRSRSVAPLSSLQQAQIESHQGLVRSIALKVAVKLPVAVELDDLIGYGQVGLMQAARGFNPVAGVQFATYSHYRIRGSIYDGVGKMAWFGGARAADLRADRAANELLRQRAEQRPDSSEDSEDDADCKGTAASAKSESDAAWLGTTGRSLAAVFLLSQSATAEESRRPDPVDPGVDPADAAGAAEIFARLRTLVDDLPEDAAALIRDVYFEGLSLKDAGVRIGISRGWASRLHAKALARLGREIRRTLL